MRGMCGMEVRNARYAAHGAAAAPLPPSPRIDVPPSSLLAPGTAVLQRQISGFLPHSISYFLDMTPNISVFSFCILYREKNLVSEC